MKRKWISVAAGAFLLAAPATQALAAPPEPPLGQYVAGMAPKHPREHGAEFGPCVSAMARGLECPHH